MKKPKTKNRVHSSACVGSQQDGGTKKLLVKMCFKNAYMVKYLCNALKQDLVTNTS